MRSSSKADRPLPRRELTGLALLAVAVAIFEGALTPLAGSLLLPLLSATAGTWVLARRSGAGNAGAALAAAGFAAAWAAGAPGGPSDPVAHLPWGLVALDACARAPGAARLALVLVADLLLFGAAPPGARAALTLAVGAWALGDPAPGRARRIAAAGIGALLGVLASPHGRGAFWPDAAVVQPGFALDQALGLAPDGAGAPVTSALLGFALAAVLGGARGAVALMGAGAWAVAVGVPGVRELWGRLPVLGLAAPATLAAPAALLLGLTAARGLGALAPRARQGAALVLATAIGLALWLPSPGRAQRVPLDVPGEIVAWELHAGAARDGTPLVTGSIDAGLPVDRARVRLFPLGDPEAQPIELELELDEPGPADGRRVVRRFRVSPGAPPPGRWLVALSLERSVGDGEYQSLGIRRLGVHEVARAGCGRAARVALAALVVLLLLMPSTGIRAWAAAGLALAQALVLAWCGA